MKKSKLLLHEIERLEAEMERRAFIRRYMINQQELQVRDWYDNERYLKADAQELEAVRAKYEKGMK